MFLTSVLLSGLLAMQAAADLDKPQMQLPPPSLDGGLWGNLDPTRSNWHKWEWGWIPDRCRDVANDNGFSPYDMEVLNVQYTDCGMAWVLCRHNNAEPSQIQMIDIFGRLPVRMRQWVRWIIALPGNGVRHAYTFSDLGDSYFFGDIQNSPTLWVHEIGHSLDYLAASANTDFSRGQTWLDAYNKDPAISDGYAARNQQENFAQEVVIALYDKVVPGGIGTVVPNWSSIYNQHTAVQRYLGGALVPGSTCQRRTRDADIVCIGPAAPCGNRSKRDFVGPTGINSTWVEANNPIEVVDLPKGPPPELPVCEI